MRRPFGGKVPRNQGAGWFYQRPLLPRPATDLLGPQPEPRRNDIIVTLNLGTHPP